MTREELLSKVRKCTPNFGLEDTYPDLYGKYGMGVYSLTGKMYVNPAKISSVEQMNNKRWVVQNASTKKWYIFLRKNS